MRGSGIGKAVGVAARADQRGLAEHQHVGQRRSSDAARPGCVMSRSGARQTASTFFSRGVSQQAGLRELRHQRARHDDRVAAIVAALRGERVGIEAVMQRQRAAAEQPGHHGQREAGERAGGAAAEHARVRLDAAFEQRGEAAGDQLGVVARHRRRARRA